MDTRQDFIVGLVVVVAIGVVMGTLIATSGWGERRYALFLRTASAEGLTVDSRVILQGLEVGRVTRLSPAVDSSNRRVSFVARLSILERFADGSELRLPVGTRAELAPASQISTAVEVRLLLPDTVGRLGAMLGAGDTIPATRRGSPLEAISTVAGELSTEVKGVLQQTTRTLVRLQSTLAHVDRTVDDLLPDVRASLGNVATTTARLDTLLAAVQARDLPDSLVATLAATNRLIARLDSLTGTATALATENRAAITQAVANVNFTTRQLNHFIDAMSRRPYRLLTGVRPLPLPPDTVADSARLQGSDGKP